MNSQEPNAVRLPQNDSRKRIPDQQDASVPSVNRILSCRDRTAGRQGRGDSSVSVPGETEDLDPIADEQPPLHGAHSGYGARNGPGTNSATICGTV